MRETELLEAIYARSRGLAGAGGVVVGPGDDCAVVEIGGSRLLLTVDQLVAGRHYDPGRTPVELIARKAIARSVSDIAAMGGMPVASLAAGVLPRGCEHGDALCAALHAWGIRLGAPVVGGDIAVGDGPEVLSITVVGRCEAGREPVLRSGARPGDAVWVTGSIGDSFATGWHLEFEPRVQEALWLARELGDKLHAMIDVSDGLGRDAGRIAAASSASGLGGGMRIEIELDAVPMRTVGRDAVRACADGEDYELVFCVDAGAALPGVCAETGVKLTRIGRVAQGDGSGAGGWCAGVRAGKVVADLTEAGWDHAG